MSNFTSLPVVVATLHADLKRERAVKAELLAALQGLLEVAEGKTMRPGNDWKLIDAARAAIAKAGGAA